MCLTLRQNPEQARKPYNRSRIRWKLAVRDENRHLATYFRGQRIERSRLNVASEFHTTVWGDRERLDESRYGFHVFVHRVDAEALSHSYHHAHVVLLKVRVSGHLRSGTFQRCESETWKSYRVLSVTPIPNASSSFFS